MLEVLVAQWPFVLAAGGVAMGFAGWVQRLKQVEELELKIRELQRQAREHDSRIHKPSNDEVERYGVAKRRQAARGRHPIGGQALFLAGLLVAGSGLLASAIQLQESRAVATRNAARQAAVAARIRDVDRQLVSLSGQMSTLEGLLDREIRGEAPLTGQSPMATQLRVYLQLLRATQADLLTTRTELQRIADLDQGPLRPQ